MTEKIVQLIDNEGDNIYPVAGALKSGSVTTSTIANNAVTAPKIDFSTLSGNYSTSEKDTGYTWIDGSPIYKKTIDIGALPDTSDKSVAHNITNLGKVIKLEGYARRTDNNLMFPLPFTSNSSVAYSIGLTVTDTNITLGTGSDRTNITECYVTLYYTKSS